MTTLQLDTVASRLGAGWTVTSGGKHEVIVRFEGGGEVFEAGIRRCVDGRLRDAYPVSAHDVEIFTPAESKPSTHRLADLTNAIVTADPHCRRVVFAVHADDQPAFASVQAAGFRYVVDVDLVGAEVSLLVTEPRWVAEVDARLDQVPDS